MLGTEKPFISIGERKMRNREKKKLFLTTTHRGKKNEVALSPLLEAHLIMEACTEPQTEKKKKGPKQLVYGEKKKTLSRPRKKKRQKKKRYKRKKEVNKKKTAACLAFN